VITNEWMDLEGGNHDILGGIQMYSITATRTCSVSKIQKLLMVNRRLILKWIF